MNPVEITAASNNNSHTNNNNDSDQKQAPSPANAQASESSQEGHQAIVVGKDGCDSSKSGASGNQVKDANKTYDETSKQEQRGEESQPNNESKEEDKNDSSTLSTAFTISFEDESANSKKLFGIRDSIRKFAPPKPHTIEKPRPAKTEGQENSYMSIESAPGGYANKTFNRGVAANASCRSKSDSSRHSNISESAAFLIDKMLNCKQGESLSSICLDDESKMAAQASRSKSGSAKKKLATRSSEDILDDDVDFCEEKSDNGTYIVGADPESDAARKKIDELFGVVKAAEASIIAASNAKLTARPLATISRQSRLSDKKPISRDRQEHINRLATVRNSSRSSSSSRQEVASSTSHKQRPGARHSRNSSCDRASKLPSSRPRRAASQSSRQSSNKELSDGDTQSSRSSLHTDTIDITNSDIQPANHPSMKFNRAFALRRARLGLGEPLPPTRMTSTPTSNCLSQEPDSLSISPRRAVNSRYGQSNSSGQQNLSRTDGGRFSLRMKNAPAIPNRLAGLHGSGRALGQQGALIESYMNKVASSKMPSQGNVSNQTSPVHQGSSHQQTSITMPYQSSDELEISSPSRYKSLHSKSASHQRPPRKEHHSSEVEADSDYYARFNYSLNLEPENYNSSESNMRSATSASRGAGGSSQLGALDCLVISAISSLSVKIRGSVCDLMVEHAKRLPAGNETRSVVEEILPQLRANSARPKSPTSIEEIDQSLYFDLAQTLKNLKKVEQIVDVMKLISNQIQPNSATGSSSTHTSTSRSSTHHQNTGTSKQAAAGDSNTNSESNSLSPV